jgi:tetratricopeptide (TPR) repeat protein
MAEQTGDMLSQARVHYFTALAWDQHGDHHQAADHAYSALRLFRTVNDPVWQANTLNLMGWIQIHLGHYMEAQASCESALVLHRRHRPGPGRDAATLDTLGLVAHHLHDYDRALDYYHQALAQSRDDGDTYIEAGILEHLAETHLTLNHHGQAHDAWKQALKLYQTQYRLTDAERVGLKIAVTTRRPRAGHPT